jgi:hypothetical protein
VPRISPLERNSLNGFATVRIKELRLTIKDVAVHESHGKLWAALPSKPQIKDGQLVTNTSGKLADLQVRQPRCERGFLAGRDRGGRQDRAKAGGGRCLKP